MIQVKEFLNKNNVDKDINEWIQKNDENIEVIDIKTTLCFNTTYDHTVSGGTIIYKDLIKQRELDNKIAEAFTKSSSISLKQLFNR